MKIMGISDSPLLNTSYGSQTSLWASSMGMYHEVLVAPRQRMIGKPMKIGSYTMIPYDTERINYMLSKGMIDILYTHTDIQDTAKVGRQSNDFVWIARIPLDAEYVDPGWRPLMNNIDCVVTESEHSLRSFQMIKKDVKKIYPHMHPAYLGREINSEPRFPWRKEDEFVMLSVIRPFWRKNLPAILVALHKLVHQEKRNVKLFLHSDFKDDAATKIDYALMIDALDLEKHIYMPNNMSYHMGYSEEVMRTLYQNCDVMVSANLGEGFGLTTVESMLMGTPVIVPRSTSGPELVGKDRGLLIDIKKQAEVKNITRDVPSVDSMVDNVIFYMDNPDEKEAAGKAGNEWANASFRFDKLNEQWLDLINEYNLNTVIINEDKVRRPPDN
jgi:glycosyltransferase involved in cell wall biosynthesis